MSVASSPGSVRSEVIGAWDQSRQLAADPQACTPHTLTATGVLRTQRAKVPAVIASKSKEELEVYVLDLLKKLKARDKRIEGVTGNGRAARGGESCVYACLTRLRQLHIEFCRFGRCWRCPQGHPRRGG